MIKIAIGSANADRVVDWHVVYILIILISPWHYTRNDKIAFSNCDGPVIIPYF